MVEVTNLAARLDVGRVDRLTLALMHARVVHVWFTHIEH